MPRDPDLFAAGREGFIPLRILLKPSRGRALTNLGVTRYYNGPVIKSEVLRAKVTRYNESEASSVVLRLQEMYKDLTERKTWPAPLEKLERLQDGGIHEQVLYDIKWLTALNPYSRSSAASRYAYPTKLPIEPALPFLIELLGDPEASITNLPATEAARALAKIGVPAIESLVEALKHENSDVRRGAAPREDRPAGLRSDGGSRVGNHPIAGLAGSRREHQPQLRDGRRRPGRRGRRTSAGVLPGVPGNPEPVPDAVAPIDEPMSIEMGSTSVVSP